MITTPPYERLTSLDAFRGATMAAMILVNNPGRWSSVYSQLRHAQWNGWTFTDCVFPFFIFIVGVSIVFSLSRRRRLGVADSTLALLISRRALIIFALGLLLNAYPYFSLSDVRIPGVLQRIAVCYLAASLIVLGSGVRGQIAWTVGLLVTYWLLMQFYPVPGIGPGVYEPGRNFAAYIDSLCLSGHMWSSYKTWDPEGIISTIPAIGTALFGALAAQWLKSDRSGDRKTAGMLLMGIALIALGRSLDPVLPINKNLWTSSYSIFMAGMALICFSGFYWVIDVKGYRRWATPFVIFGVNAITGYLLAGAVDILIRWPIPTFETGSVMRIRTFVYELIFAGTGNGKAASLLFAAAFVMVIFIPLWGMWKKRWFLRI